MNTRTRIGATLRFAFASGTLALGLWSIGARAEPGDVMPVPPAQYSSLPSGDPDATGSLPDARGPGAGSPSGFQALVAQGAITLRASAPTQCLPPELLAVVADVSARFGPVTMVSTTRLNTDNHSPGSTRDKLHTSCKAVDFKVQGRLQEVLAYLRTRKEVNGINSYRNNLVHIDFNERHSVAGVQPARQRRPWPQPVQSVEAPAPEPAQNPLFRAAPDTQDRTTQGQ